MDDEAKATIKEFNDAVNMTSGELQRWLRTEESKEVGFKEHEGDESKGHESGRHIVELLGKKHDAYDEHDIAEMKRVVGYVHRHLAQRPSGDIEDTRWRYSLMNWGHDPLKK